MSQILDEIQRARDSAPWYMRPDSTPRYFWESGRWQPLTGAEFLFEREKVSFPTDIDRAKHARDKARIEHDVASEDRARITADPDASSTIMIQSHSNLITARSRLYAAEGEYAARVRDADVKTKAEEIEAAKRETLAKIEASIDELDSDDIALDLGWDFLDAQAKQELDDSALYVLRSCRERLASS